MTTTQDRLTAKCDALKELLLRKNRAYGDSALDPVRVFSTANPVEQLKVRIDDKLSRLQRGTATEAVPEDTLMDLCGYLILLMVAQETETPPPAEDNVGPLWRVDKPNHCPLCASPNRFKLRGVCASDMYDPHEWHRAL